ncbi:MAG: hypothetical protein ACP5IM_05845 [Candidatus Bathyarchaeia archaeon]
MTEPCIKIKKSQKEEYKIKEKSDFEQRQKFCGNCGNHMVYEYPNKIFCSMLFCKGKNPIVETLSCCEYWNPSSQECYCIKEALKSGTNK